MKFQNPSLNSVLTGRTDGRTDKPKPICSPLFQSWGHNELFSLLFGFIPLVGGWGARFHGKSYPHTGI